jgi:hypothetical protein
VLDNARPKSNKPGRFWKRIEFSMLVVLNGAPKGGSTWLVDLVRSIDHYSVVPQKFQDKNWKNSSIDRRKLSQFLSEVDFKSRNYFCKQHWSGFPEAKELLRNRDIRMINIVRDLRDVLVSRYFFDKLRGAFTGDSLAQFYEDTGRRIIAEYIAYHVFWHSTQPEPLLVSFEGLKLQFRTTVVAMLEYLRLTRSDADIVKLRGTDVERATDGRTIKEGSFHRESAVGGWRKHLDPDDEILRDVDTLCREAGYYDTLFGARQRFRHLNLDYAI